MNEARTEKEKEQSPIAPSGLPLIADERAYYHGLLAGGGPRAPLDRSKLFRYKEDDPALRQEFLASLRSGKRRTLLEIGIGNLEEPLSYLATAYDVARSKGKNLEDTVDLTMVDIRPREDLKIHYGLGKSAGALGLAFLSEEEKRRAVLTPIPPHPKQRKVFQFSEETGEYEFLPAIREYLEKRLQDPEKAFLGTSLERFLKELPVGEQYGIVACNNVLQHIGGPEAYASPFKNRDLPAEAYQDYFAVVGKILDHVQPGGVAIIHTDGGFANILDTRGRGTKELFERYKDQIPQLRNFEEIENGIYRRKD